MVTADAVCFDLDGTLCVQERSDREFHGAVFERAGVDPPFTPADLRAIDPDAIEPAGGIAGFFTNLYRATLREVDAGIDPGDPLVAELGKIAGELYDPTAVRFREGAEAALRHARERGEVGLITNGRRETQTAKLEALGIADAFDAAVFCDPDLGIEGKPSREPFELALADLSTDPGRTAFVGDSHAEDVVGALAAGLQSVWVPTNRPHESPPSNPEPEPTHRLASLSELRRLL